MSVDANAEELARLQSRVAQLERTLSASNLHSPSFLPRAFAVWGHFIVAHLILAVVIGVPLAVMSALLGR